MPSMWCPACERRTVHTYVRLAGQMGRVPKCRGHIDVDERIEKGEYELVTWR